MLYSTKDYEVLLKIFTLTSQTHPTELFWGIYIHIICLQGVGLCCTKSYYTPRSIYNCFWYASVYTLNKSTFYHPNHVLYKYKLYVTYSYRKNNLNVTHYSASSIIHSNRAVNKQLEYLCALLVVLHTATHLNSTYVMICYTCTYTSYMQPYLTKVIAGALIIDNHQNFITCTYTWQI